MNRPRNRQVRPPRNNTKNDNKSTRSTRTTASTTSNDVPSTVQVTPGAYVSIVQKADQPTGREVSGVVQDVLTRGDHPRGIKVRLLDGRIGRVQRMAPSHASESVDAPSASVRSQPGEAKKTYGEHHTSAGDTSSNLSDYIVPGKQQRKAHAALAQDTMPSQSTAVARCPICEVFEGDELAVSFHIQEHLDGEAT